MEYARTASGQIQADFARRAGQLLLQYERLSRALPAKDRYESTLTLALLQSMLTICWELLKDSQSSRRTSVSALFGLAPECVVQSWPAARGLTYREVFECLRNSLSHPGVQQQAVYPVTGYTTMESGSGQIEQFEFVWSPWVNGTGSDLLSRYAPRDASDSVRVQLLTTATHWASNHGVDGLAVQPNAAGLWRVAYQGQPFVPVLKLRLDVRQLRTLALTLSDQLAALLPASEALHA